MGVTGCAIRVRGAWSRVVLPSGDGSARVLLVGLLNGCFYAFLNRLSSGQCLAAMVLRRCLTKSS